MTFSPRQKLFQTKEAMVPKPARKDCVLPEGSLSITKLPALSISRQVLPQSREEMDVMPAPSEASAKVLNDFPTAAADGRVFMGNDQDLHWI